MKRIFSLFVCVLLVFSCCAVIASAQETSTSIEYFEDGSYVVTTLVQNNPNGRTGISGSKSSVYYTSSGSSVFSVTLTGYFSYTYGTSSKATGEDVTVAVYDSSASYVTKSSYHSGATAYGSGTVSYRGYQKTLSVQITCDKYGNLS